MYWADGIGAAEVYRQIQQWHQQYGERWAPAPLLRRLAETNTPCVTQSRAAGCEPSAGHRCYIIFAVLAIKTAT